MLVFLNLKFFIKLQKHKGNLIRSTAASGFLKTFLIFLRFFCC